MLIWEIERLPVKHHGISILDLMHTPNGNWTALCVVNRNLVTDLWGCIKFWYGDHVQLLRDGCTEIRRRKAHESRDALVAVDRVLLQTYNRRILRGHKWGHGYW